MTTNIIRSSLELPHLKENTCNKLIKVVAETHLHAWANWSDWQSTREKKTNKQTKILKLPK